MKHDDTCCPECGRPHQCCGEPDEVFYDRRERCGSCGGVTGSAAQSCAPARLPVDAVAAGSTPTMDEKSLLEPMQKFHMTPRGRYAVVVVESGRLQIEWHDEKSAAEATPGHPVVIPPECFHRVRVSGPVKFHVEFYRQPGWQGKTDETAPRPGEKFTR